MSETMTALELRDHLRGLGYDARCVNGDCYDIHRNGYVHYLSRREALALNRSGIDLLACSVKRGLNRWYDFNQSDRNLERGSDEGR